MTYAEVKAKYTTVESIDNRLNEIDELTKIGSEKYTEAINTYMNDVNDVLKKFNITEYHVNVASDRNVSFKPQDNNGFYEFDIYPSYEYDWRNTNKKVWSFSLNISSYGNVRINNLDERSIKVLKYYEFVAMIINNKEFAKELEDTCHKNVDNLYKINKEYSFTSEEQQLRILKKNLVKEADIAKMTEAVKNAEDKTQVVIINKKADPSVCIAKHRGTPVTICSMPEPNGNWHDMDARCKKMNKNEYGARYIATEIRFIKF